MLFLRSAAFNLAWYVNLVVQMLVQAPYYFLVSHRASVNVVQRWAGSNHVLQRWLAGTRVEWQGLENVPKGAAIIASKHQSIWEFYAVHHTLDDPAFVLKHDLMRIPLFGWYVAKTRHIPIRRGDRSKALREMMRVARERVNDGRQILIFPEGTRKAPGAEPDYRYGVVRMYTQLGVPVAPVALVSGLYWPRRQFARHPGTLRARYMPPIEPGMAEDAFHAHLREVIEMNTEDLYLQTSLDPVHPPLNAEVRAAIERAKTRRRERGLPTDRHDDTPIMPLGEG